MSMHHTPAPHHQVIFQADPNVVHTLRSMRDQIHHVCRTHVNRMVRIQTLDGHVYEGVIVGCDSGHLYLNTHMGHGHGGHRPPYGPTSAAITTLVLFELLVIVLLL